MPAPGPQPPVASRSVTTERQEDPPPQQDRCHGVLLSLRMGQLGHFTATSGTESDGHATDPESRTVTGSQTVTGNKIHNHP